MTRLIDAAGEGDLSEVKDLLNNKSYNQESINWTLIYAAENGYLEVVEYLVKKRSYRYSSR